MKSAMQLLFSCISHHYSCQLFPTSLKCAADVADITTKVTFYMSVEHKISSVERLITEWRPAVQWEVPLFKTSCNVGQILAVSTQSGKINEKQAFSSIFMNRLSVAIDPMFLISLVLVKSCFLLFLLGKSNV